MKFGRRSAVIHNRASNTGAVLHDFKSLCKGPISETVQDSYNSGPFKSKFVCPLALAVIFISLVTWQRPVSALTDINADKLAEFFFEEVEGVCVAVVVVCSPWCIYATSVLSSFHWGSAAVMTRSPVEVPLSSETVKGIGWKLETTGVTHPLWKISGYATGWLFNF